MTGAEFWTNVDSDSNPTGCWPWMGGRFKHRGGYGQVRFAGRSQRAHRVAYALAVGPIPEGLTVDHVRARGCTDKACCNPNHLEAVPLAENIARTARPTCRRGHSKTSEHGRARGTKWRCVTCETQRQRERRAAKAVA